MGLRFVKPDISHKDKVRDYQYEFFYEKVDSGNMAMSIDYDLWLEYIRLKEDEKTLPYGEVWEFIYFVFKDDNLIGVVNIRPRLDLFLERYIGNIGYSVRKSERNKGYGKKILNMALDICKSLDINSIILTSREDNISSIKVIEYNGGKYLESVKLDDYIINRYRIDLD